MIPIKQIIYQNGVSQVFRLVVPAGSAYAGTHEIKMPKGWNEVDSVVDIDSETFFTKNFIIGDTTKLVFSEFSNPEAYYLVRNLYRESGGDARAIFKYIAVKDGIEYDLLGENFEINFNKYTDSLDKTKMKIETELIKSEAQNKLITRYDTTVNLFEEKDLDDKPVTAIQRDEIGFKKGNSLLTNFYTWDISQLASLYSGSGLEGGTAFFCFRRSDDYEFGDNDNVYAGKKVRAIFTDWQDYMGPFVSTRITLNTVKVEITDLHFVSSEKIYLKAAIKIGGTNQNYIHIKESENPSGSAFHEIKIDFLTVDIGTLQPGQSLTFEVLAQDGYVNTLISQKDNTSIKITTNIESPLVRTSAIKLISAMDQLAKLYTSSELTVESNIIGTGGAYNNTSISTGAYLRGLPANLLPRKLKTSLKSLMDDGAAKLMALGYDVLNDKMVVEDVGYFFKDLRVYDLSEKVYLSDSVKMEHDKDLSYNAVTFGTKKYSTNKRFDIQNFNTTVEVSTPIKSNKAKFDKQTDLIIDADRIQELVEDKSSATNDGDDDLVLIDMVNLTDTWDEGVFDSCQHVNDNGKLLIKCTAVPFDTTLIKVGQTIQITEGINVGTWTVFSIDGFKMVLFNVSSGSIQEGAADTRMRYQIDVLTKNRTNEGFNITANTIRNPTSTTNIRHNPKYHMARWFPYFGSGLRKKKGTELLKVTNYKNNSEAKMSIATADMANELQGEILVGGNEELSRLRDYQATFFTGENIEITYNRVTWEEFMAIYTNWKFGAGGVRNKSRGYLTCNTPFGILDVYPFGDSAFSHSKLKNTLNIKGKVKGISVDNPVLLSVVQVSRYEVAMTWDYVPEYVEPTIKIQISTDGVNWQTIKTVVNVKTSQFTSASFEDYMTGDDVIFRVVASSAEFSNKISNTLTVDWKFNDWTVRELSRTENINCGYSYLSLEFKGNIDLNIEWNFECYPGGGAAAAINTLEGTNLVSFTSPYGAGYSEIKNTSLTVSGTNQITVQVNNSNRTPDNKLLNCNAGNSTWLTSAAIVMNIDDGSGDIKQLYITVDTLKKYRNNGGGIDLQPAPEE